jgi:protein phosphatase
VQLTYAAASIIGRCRKHNEDAWGASEAARVFVVADGCGGRGPGRPAADAVVSTLLRYFSDGPTAPSSHLPTRMEPLAAALQLANDRIVELAVGPNQGMGAACAAMRIEGQWVGTAHVGDCRIYRYHRGHSEFVKGVDPHGGLLTAVTADHSLLLEYLKNGSTFAEAAEVSERHATVITRALGYGMVNLDVQYLRAEPGDLYLLCTDGVTRQLSNTEIREIISGEGALAARCEKLLHAADAKRGADNVTAILGSYGSPA